MSLNEVKAVTIVELIQLMVTQENLRLLLLDSTGEKLALDISDGLAREIVHIMADGLRLRASKEFDREHGHLLVKADVQPAHVERSISPLGLQEKYVLHAKSEGSTQITFRLTEESVRKWIDDMEKTLASKGKKPRLSS